MSNKDDNKNKPVGRIAFNPNTDVPPFVPLIEERLAELERKMVLIGGHNRDEPVTYTPTDDIVAISSRVIQAKDGRIAELKSKLNEISAIVQHGDTSGINMKIYNEWGEYTDEFNAFLDTVLSPKLNNVVDVAKCWLDKNNATAIDYKILEGVIISEITMPLMSVWMQKIGQRDLGDSQNE